MGQQRHQGWSCWTHTHTMLWVSVYWLLLCGEFLWKTILKIFVSAKHKIILLFILNYWQKFRFLDHHQANLPRNLKNRLHVVHINIYVLWDTIKLSPVLILGLISVTIAWLHYLWYIECCMKSWIYHRKYNTNITPTKHNINTGIRFMWTHRTVNLICMTCNSFFKISCRNGLVMF